MLLLSRLRELDLQRRVHGAVLDIASQTGADLQAELDDEIAQPEFVEENATGDRRRGPRDREEHPDGPRAPPPHRLR